MAAAAAEADPEPDAQEGFVLWGKLRADAWCSQMGRPLVLSRSSLCKPHLSSALTLTR